MYQDVLISPVSLQAAMDAGDTVVLDCRFQLADPEAGRRAYLTDHVPGAFFMDLDQDLSSAPREHGGRHPLPAVEALATRLREAGVNGHTLVVAYDDSRFAFAARMWWLLRYLGHAEVRVLNGGYAAWKAASLPLSTAVPDPVRGDFTPMPNERMVIDHAAVMTRGQWGDPPLIDAREQRRYRGDEEPIDPIAGHIPGAVCQPWQEFTDAEGNAIPEADNRARWSFLPHDAQPIVYCGSGVTACVNVLSLHAAGYRGMRLYAGSWSDWCSYPNAPVATAAHPTGVPSNR